MDEHPGTHTPVTYDSCAHILGPFHHGTKSALETGAELAPGHGSNFQGGRVSGLAPGSWTRGVITRLRGA